MNLRDALVQQSPSLALQRAAADEIAKLDSTLNEFLRKYNKAANKVYDLESYLEAHDLIKDFDEWLARSTEK